MNLSEKEYNNLYKYTLNISSKYVGYKDMAYDIAQNAMLALISSKSEIVSPYTWIRTTVRREASKHLSEEKKNRTLVQRKSEEPAQARISETADKDDFAELNLLKVYSILSKEDYAVFKSMKKVDFKLVEYAEKNDISYNTANSQKKRIKRNIQSALLWEEGWRRTDKILNYAQHNNIVRFIKLIKDSLHSNNIKMLKNHLQKIDKEKFEQLFKGVETCIDWHIINTDGEYKLIMAFSPINPQPRLFELTIVFNHMNYLKVSDAIEKQPFLVVNSDVEAIMKYEEKGKVNLTRMQLVSLLTNLKTDT
jgi:DNA-directed RNA polymerase specialized sigma24 family protein